MPIGDTRMSEPLLWLVASAHKDAAPAFDPAPASAAAETARSVVEPMSNGLDVYHSP